MVPPPIRALIAEDDSLVADVIEEELRLIGISTVGRATDGRQAVELTCSLRPDVVLMDVQMPEMGGLEATRELSKRCPTPVVFVTVHSGLKIFQEALAAGAGAVVTKPPDGKTLLRAINTARSAFRGSERP